MSDHATGGRPLVSTYVDSAPLPAGLADEPWSVAAATWRLAELAPDLPFAVPADATYAGGESNDAWLFGDDVLRICWRADRGRLLREAELLLELPGEIPHADVTACGAGAGMSWVLSPRLPGTPVTRLPAGTLDERGLREVFRQLAHLLRTLHEWTPSPRLRALLDDRPDLDPEHSMTVWAADVVPLPVRRVPAIAALATTVPFVDPGLVDCAVERITALADPDPFGDDADRPRVVVHGDTTLANVLVRDGRVTGLIDFEHARTGPRDLELLSPVAFMGGFGTGWLREDYPELFAHPRLRERVWLYELCCGLRQLIWWPPTPEQHGDDHPPVRTLRRLVDAPTPW